MRLTTTNLLLAALICYLPNSLSAQKLRFADQALLGAHIGYDRDYIGEWDFKFEEAVYYGARAGLSINNWLFAGIQTRFVQARNFETEWQNFYMAGIWGRGYILRPGLEKNTGRLGVFLESGFLAGNFSFDTKNSTEYYMRRKGQWYIPFMAGLECRVANNLTLEGSANLFYNSGQNWDQYGFAYLSLGLNWYVR